MTVGISDRITAAREALAMHDAGMVRCQSSDPAERYDVSEMMAAALRALTEPDPTNEGPEEIAERVLYAESGTDIRNIVTKAVTAGILAAWESWESE